MSQQNRQKKQPNSIPKRKSKFQIIAAILLLIFVAIGRPLLYHHHTQQLAINKERAQFESATLRLEALEGKIAASTGNPFKVIPSQECSRPHLEFSKGPLSCETGQLLVYGVNTVGQVQDIVTKTIGMINSSENLNSKYALPNGSLEFTELAPGNEPQEKSSTYKKDGLNCGAGYEYIYSDDSINNYSKIIPPSKSIFLIEISCGSPARAEYYPVKN